MREEGKGEGGERPARVCNAAVNPVWDVRGWTCLPRKERKPNPVEFFGRDWVMLRRHARMSAPPFDPLVLAGGHGRADWRPPVSNNEN